MAEPEPRRMTEQQGSFAIFAGQATLDLCYGLENLPARNDKARTETFWKTPGGPAFNAALTYAKLGGRAVLLTSAPRTALAESIYAAAEGWPLTIIHCSDNGRDVPLSTVVVHPSNGDRSIVSHAQPDQTFTLPELDWNAAQFLFWDGHYPHLYEQCLARKARVRTDLPVVYDGGSWKANNAAFLETITLPVLSERFAGSRGAQGWLRGLRRAHAPIITTRGGQSVVYEVGGETHYLPVPHIHVSDTLGAGDVFHGAIAYGHFAEGYDLREAILFASAIAAFSCQRSTPHWWQPAEALEFSQDWMSGR